MSLFQDRERAFERMFVHEEELRFKAAARRNRRIAEWACKRRGLECADAEAYAHFIVRLGAFFGDDGVRERILHDLNRAGMPVSQHRVRRMMDEFLASELAGLTSPHAAALEGSRAA